MESLDLNDLLTQSVTTWRETHRSDRIRHQHQTWTDKHKTRFHLPPDQQRDSAGVWQYFTLCIIMLIQWRQTEGGFGEKEMVKDFLFYFHGLPKHSESPNKENTSCYTHCNVLLGVLVCKKSSSSAGNTNCTHSTTNNSHVSWRRAQRWSWYTTVYDMKSLRATRAAGGKTDVNTSNISDQSTWWPHDTHLSVWNISQK